MQFEIILEIHTAWKVSKYEVFSGPYFPVFGLNIGKYGPEKTPHMNTLHAVLLWILEGPVDLLFFSSFITDNISSLLVGDTKKELEFRFFRYSEYLCFGFVKFSSICLAMEVKCLLNSLAIS